MKKTVLTILICLGVITLLIGCGKKLTKEENKIKIVKSETKSIKYTDFDNGLIKMKIP